MRVAIVIVCRNALPALRTTIASLQSLADARIAPIIIDGASTDGTPEYLREMSDWTYFAVSEPDAGIYDAMNKGWRAAPQDAYILYLGAGDRLLELPQSDDLMDHAGRPWQLVMGVCTVGSMPFTSRWGWEMRLRNTAHHQAMMLHKSVSPQPPFDNKLRVYADWDFNLRLQKMGITVHRSAHLRSYATPDGASWSMNIDEIQSVARRHSGRIVGALSLALNSVSRWRRFRGNRAS